MAQDNQQAAPNGGVAIKKDTLTTVAERKEQEAIEDFCKRVKAVCEKHKAKDGVRFDAERERLINSLINLCGGDYLTLNACVTEIGDIAKGVKKGIVQWKREFKIELDGIIENMKQYLKDLATRADEIRLRASIVEEGERTSSRISASSPARIAQGLPPVPASTVVPANVAPSPVETNATPQGNEKKVDGEVDKFMEAYDKSSLRKTKYKVDLGSHLVDETPAPISNTSGLGLG